MNCSKKIIEYLKTLHPELWFVEIKLSDKRGTPNILCCYRGKFIGFEVKTPNSKAAKHQIFQGQLINMAGGLWFVVNDVEQVKIILKGIIQ